MADGGGSHLERRQTEFRKLVTAISQHLLPEEVARCCFVRMLPSEKFGTALQVLEHMMRSGQISHWEVEPLAKLLRDISRHDLVNELVEPFRRDFPDTQECECTEDGRGREWEGRRSCPPPTSLTTTQCQSAPLSLKSLNTEEKRQLLHSLCSDPDLQSEFQTRTPTSPISQSSHMTSHVTSPGDSIGSPDTAPDVHPAMSCPASQLHTEEEKEEEKDTQSLSQSLPSSSEPVLVRQVSDDGFCYLVHKDGKEKHRAESICTLTPPATPSHAKRKIEWSISRVELGRRIVEHSNSPFIRGNFSLGTDGVSKIRLRNPVSLVFKVYPCGLRRDENESLTLEVLVDCRCKDLLAVAKVNLEITLSMESHRKFVSTRKWIKPLRTFRIYDFLPHEVVTRNYGKTLDFAILAFIAYD